MLIFDACADIASRETIQARADTSTPFNSPVSLIESGSNVCSVRRVGDLEISKTCLPTVNLGFRRGPSHSHSIDKTCSL